MVVVNTSRFPVRLTVIVILFLQTIPAFCQVDSLEFWSYTLHTYSKTKSDKSIGRITFSRSKPVHERGNPDDMYTGECLPSITYFIYGLADSIECKGLSRRARVYSSCWGPSMGGDFVAVGNYIFLNRDVCVNCVCEQPGVDHCRPTVNRILTNVNVLKAKSLEELVGQFGIEGRVDKVKN